MIKIFTILFLFCFTSTRTYSQDMRYDSIVMIVDQKMELKHHDHEVEVVRKNDGYWVFVYRMNGDTLQPMRVGFRTKEYFSRAAYKWDLENGVIVDLINEETGSHIPMLTIRGNKPKP